MRRSLLRLWLGTSPFVFLLLSGCSVGERALFDDGPLSPYASNGGELTRAAQAMPGGTIPSTYHVRAAVAVPGGLPIATVSKVEWQGPGAGQALQLARLEQPVPRDQPAELACPEPGPVTRLGRPRPFSEALRHPSFAHATDYSWLVGYLSLVPCSDTWSVRYGTPEQEDDYDGALVLVNPGPMKGFYSGQLVRVEGRLVDPGPHEIKPAYSVRAIQALQQP
jgi:hypothetical protein